MRPYIAIASLFTQYLIGAYRTLTLAALPVRLSIAHIYETISLVFHMNKSLRVGLIMK